MNTNWSIPTMDDAAAKKEFVLINTWDPAATATRATIDDARKLWAINTDVLFQTGYRIAGLPAPVTAALLAAGIPQPDVDAVLGSAIDYANHTTTMAQVYTDEVNEYEAHRRAVVAANTAAPGARMFDVIGAVNPAVAAGVGRADARLYGLAAPAKPKGRAAKSLADKINGLAAGKVLDVSSLKPDGTGSRAINPPTRSGKQMSQQLPMVSSDLEHYLLAISMLPGGEVTYAQDVAYMRQLFSRAPARITAVAPVGIAPVAPYAVAPIVPGGIAPVAPGGIAPVRIGAVAPAGLTPKIPGIVIPKIPGAPVLATTPNLGYTQPANPAIRIPGIIVPQAPKLNIAPAGIPVHVYADEDDEDDEEDATDEDEYPGYTAGVVAPQIVAPLAAPLAVPLAVPRVPVPQAVPVPKLPVPTIPKFNVPQLNVPKLVVPVPQITVPQVTVPQITVPTLAIPQVTVPQPVAEVVAEAVAEPEVVAEAVAEPEVVAEAATEVTAEPEVVAEAVAEPEVVAEAAAETAVEVPALQVEVYDEGQNLFKDPNTRFIMRPVEDGTWEVIGVLSEDATAITELTPDEDAVAIGMGLTPIHETAPQ